MGVLELERVIDVTGASFSGLSIPHMEDTRTEPVRVLAPFAEVDLAPLNEIYKVIFNFGDKKAEFRAQQYQYAYTCYEGISTGRDVVIEGPTGLGKTRALLAAVLPKLLAEPDARLIYSTRTVTQVNNVMDEIKDILAHNDLEGITATLHIGARKIMDKYAKCYDPVNKDFDAVNLQRQKQGKPPLDSTFCNENCRNYGARYRSLFDLDATNLVTIDSLTEKGVCPRGIMEKATEQARIAIVPHNYLYDTFWLSRYKLENAMLIVDEAHNFLADAASAATNPFLVIGGKKPGGLDKDEFIRYSDRQSNSFYLEDMIAQFVANYKYSKSGYGNSMSLEGLELDDAAVCMLYMYRELSALVEGLHNESNKVSSEDMSPAYFIEDVSSLIDSLADGFVRNLKSLSSYFSKAKQEIWNENPGYRRRFQPELYSLSQLADSLIEVIENPMDFLLVSSQGNLKFHNLHPKKNVERATKGFSPKIFTSATLSPVKDVAYLLGLREPIYAEIGPVFPASNYKSFFIIGANSASREELRESGRVFNQSEHGVLEKLFDSAVRVGAGKNIGVFCSSIPAVIETYKVLKAVQQQHDFLIIPFIQGDKYESAIETFSEDYAAALHFLGRNVNTYTGDDAIDAFKALAQHEKTCILLAVQGGTISEGVDYPNEQMEMVVTVGLPYPSSAAERRLNQAKQDYFVMQGIDPRRVEDLAYKQEAFRKLAQSIGRAHRSMTDRAVIICADERLLGVKNVLNRPPNRYEFISLENARKNLSLLQRPVQAISGNIVIGGTDPDENRALENYISFGLNIAKSDFIGFDKMVSDIKEFYRT